MSVFYPERLVWIRKKRGINKTALAEKIGVDLRSISAYESGEFPPSVENAQLLSKALGVRENFFVLGPIVGPDANQVSFRALSKLTAAKRDMALGSAAIAFEYNNWLSSQFDFPDVDIPDLRAQKSTEDAAMALRYYWKLGEKPISNMVHLLESKGVRVFSLALDIADVDACCTWYDEIPFVFLNTKKSNARRRFDAAHELAHLVLHRHGEYEGRETERDADDFASAFLMPRSGFQSTAPRMPNIANIIENKSVWGVSVSAYIMRLFKTNLISDWQYRTLFKLASQRGFRRSEPYDHKPEQSKIAEIALKQLREDGIGISKISSELAISEEDLSDLLFKLAVIPITGGKDVVAGRGGSSSASIRLVVDND
jgi:Zn-dependent peptidase ImmA (M78 family)/DNA-binding XRE family transcriptional regulator